MKTFISTIIITLCFSSCNLIFGQKSAEGFKSPDALKLYQQAQQEYSKGSAGFAKAIELLDKADRLEPENASILHERGLVKINSKIDVEGGFEDLQKSIDSSKDEKAKLIRYNNRGISYMEIGEMEKACEDWFRSGKEGESYLEEYCNQ
jgi:tetratricopeptide (TPR) repeat protein